MTSVTRRNWSTCNYAALGASIVRLVRAAVAVAALLAWAGSARAHGVGMSQLSLTVDGSHVEGIWEFNLRDARLALGLDPQLLGEPGWLDFRPHEEDFRAFLATRLWLTGDSLACPFEWTPAPMEVDSQFVTVRLHLVAECPRAPTRFGLHTEVLFDKNPTHRDYFSVQDARTTNIGALRADRRAVTFDILQFHVLATFLEFVREGLWHIWSGFDHILFLLALLLPATLVRDGQGWSPRSGFWPSMREVVKVVTAFTVAHSITLGLAYYGVVRLPTNWIEVGIAVSVFAAAWNNLRPFLVGRAWAIAFSFGLVHGLGFAGVLSNLSIPRRGRVLALAAFNGGVEIGQLAIVAGALPLLYLASRRRFYPRLVMGVGSLAIAWMAVVWVLERAFSLSLFARR